MKLAHKGIVLVLVPVAFEFLFVGSLFYLLKQSEVELERAKQARQVALHLNKIQRMFMIMTGGLPVYVENTLIKGPARNRVMNYRIDEEFKLLREAAHGNSEMIACADRMQNSLSESMYITADIKSAWKLLDKLKKFRYSKKGKGLLDDLTDQVDIMWKQLEAIEQESPLRQAENREQTKLLLLLGLGVNISLAIGLAYFFNRDTVSRLGVVIENARRLAEGKTLNKRLNGSDEIAMLDKAFVRMANDLDNLSQKERALLVNAADVICSLDGDTNITDVSPACKKIWGYEPVDLLSVQLLSIVCPDDLESTKEHIFAAKSGNVEVNFENRVIRKEGALVDMLWSVKWWPEDKTLFCVAHDNTDRKKTERMKAEFVSMLSHDLRSPLNSVQAFFTMVGDKVYGSLNDKGMAKVASLDSTISWLIEMISDLLDIDKIEAGLSDLDLKEVSLDSIVDKADEALEALCEKEQVELILPNQDVTVRADDDMLLRVVTNLLSNAIKYSPKGSRVKVEIERLTGEKLAGAPLAEGQSDALVELRVIDKGKGIAPEHQEAIFERFRQVRAGDSGKGRSSGLGLAVSKAIVERHGGTIGVRSVPDEGSTFWFRLPVNGGNAENAAS